jgi:putative YpdA family bacillithiol system oxidoreductase
MATSAARNLARDTAAALRNLQVFAALPDPALADFDRAAEWCTLRPGENVPRRARDEERYYFVAAGQLAVTIDRGGAPKSGFFKNRTGGDVEHVAFFAVNDFFSDASLLGEPDQRGARLECVGLVESALVSLPRSLLARTMRAHAEWAREMNERNAALRAHHRAHSAPERHVVQEFFLRYGYSFATTLKVIDLDRCISCNACEDACTARHGTARLTRLGPTLGRLAFPISCRTCVDHRCVAACGFDAIAYTGAKEVRVDQAKCVGCTACQSACPNDVITMVKTPYTVADFPNPMPDTQPSGQTNVGGLYLVGEASGDALIKMAINSGRRAIEDLMKSLAGARAPAGAVDVIIVGSGPSGLSAGLTAKAGGLSYLIFDKGTIASTIQNYPRHKVVMAEPAHIPLFGDLWLRDTTKEELIEKWREIIERTGLEIRCNEEVKKVEKKGELFEVTTIGGSYRARRVVFATGNRGSPRKLGAAGEASPRVLYVLTEPEEHAGKHVLVVGGGDSAVEAAMSLADVAGTHVTLSYRRDSFGRIKARNKARLDEMTANGRVEVILKSNVKEIEDGAVVMAIEGAEPRRIENQVIFALLGAEPPTKLFQAAGITILEPGSEGMAKLAKSRGDRFYASKCDHCAGHDDQACISACPTEAIFEVKPEEVFAAVGDAKARGVFSPLVFVEGLSRARSSRLERIAPAAATVAIAAVVALGIECFLRAVSPEASALHAWNLLRGEAAKVAYSSGAGLGFGLGITGTVLMVLTALYPFHARIGVLRKLARTRLWMAAHIFAGIAGPMLVTYHTKMKLDRWPAIAFWSMWAVVLTGMIGRYLYTWLRQSGGLAELEKRALGTEEKKLFDQWSGTEGRTALFRLAELRQPKEAEKRESALFASFVFFFGAAASLLLFAWMRFVRMRHVAPELRRETLRVFAERNAADRRARFLRSAERAAGVWKKIHAVMTLVLFGITAVHIVFAMLFKAA